MNKKETVLLLREWHDGDKAALDTLLARYLPWILDQVRRRMTALLRKKGESIDYAQDAVIQFLRFTPRFTLSDEKQFRSLLLRIVESTLLNRYDWFVARRREIARERPLPSDTVLSLDPPQKVDRTPSMSVERHEREGWVRLGMEFLDSEDREVLVLRKWDNASFSDIGERLGITPDAARMRHNRALKRLGEKIWALRCGKIEEILRESPAVGR